MKEQNKWQEKLRNDIFGGKNIDFLLLFVLVLNIISVNEDRVERNHGWFWLNAEKENTNRANSFATHFVGCNRHKSIFSVDCNRHY